MKRLFGRESNMQVQRGEVLRESREMRNEAGKVTRIEDGRVREWEHWINGGKFGEE